MHMLERHDLSVYTSGKYRLALEATIHPFGRLFR